MPTILYLIEEVNMNTDNRDKRITDDDDLFCTECGAIEEDEGFEFIENYGSNQKLKCKSCGQIFIWLL